MAACQPRHTARAGPQGLSSGAIMWEHSVPEQCFGPTHAGPPDHYGRLSSLLDMYVSQSGGLCHCTRRPISDRSEPTIARLRYSFGRRPPQSNCLPCAVPDPAYGSRLDISRHQGATSTTRLPRWAHSTRSACRSCPVAATAQAAAHMLARASMRGPTPVYVWLITLPGREVEHIRRPLRPRD